jgi:perosamine synthetase
MIQWDDQDIRDVDVKNVLSSLSKGVGAKGDYIKLVEDKFSNLLNVKHCILTANGTASISAAAFALKEKYNIKSIAVPSFSFIASANAAKFSGLDVHLIDCNINTWNIDTENIPSHVDAIMSVDVGGLPVDYDKLKKRKVPILADSAESLGSLYNNKLIGSQADIHTYSFQRSKIITSGEGGMIATNDTALAELCRSFINHGYSNNKKSYEYIHPNFGLNFRMCDVEAALLYSQIDRLSEYVERRNQIANIYNKELTDFKTQTISKNTLSNYFFFGILTHPNKRNKLADYLIANDISVKCWTSIHQQAKWKTQKLLPNSTHISQSNILLPIHNKITDLEIKYIIDTIRSFDD